MPECPRGHVSSRAVSVGAIRQRKDEVIDGLVRLPNGRPVGDDCQASRTGHRDVSRRSGWPGEQLEGSAFRLQWDQDDPRYAREPRLPAIARGTFEATSDLSDVCCSPLFGAGRRTPVTARFSVREMGVSFPGSLRQPHGFDVTFHGDEDWDLVASNIPVSPTRDPARRPPVAANDPAANDLAIWQLVASQPETVHHLFWIMSDWALPRSYRMMDGFGQEPVTLINAGGKRQLARFHWRARLGPAAILWEEAIALDRLAGPYLNRDLCGLIEAGEHASWQLAVQLFDFGDPAACDPTRLVSASATPLRIVGRMTLDRTAQLADDAPDPPRATGVATGMVAGPPPAASGDPYEEAQTLWRSWTASEQAHATTAFATALTEIPTVSLRAALLAHIWNVDAVLAGKLAAGIGIPPPRRRRRGPMPSDRAIDPGLSIHRRGDEHLEGKLVGVVVADGSDALQLRILIDEIDQAGGYSILIAPGESQVRPRGRKRAGGDRALADTPSVIFDAIALLLDPATARALEADRPTLEFLAEAYRHCKCIAVSAGCQPLLDAAGIPRGSGVVDIACTVEAAGRRYFDRELDLKPCAPS